MFKCDMVMSDGTEFFLFYDNNSHKLYNSSGNEIEYKEVIENQSDINTNRLNLRLVLGKKCNFKCQYCCQNSSLKQDAMALPHDELVDGIIKYCETVSPGAELSIQMWGGEPTLYLKQIDKLYNSFKKAGVKAFSTVSNGSILKPEPFEWLQEKVDIGGSISNDGPGQHLRGIDFFKDPDCYKNMLYLLGQYPRFGISTMLTKDNHDPVKIIEHFTELFGTSQFQINEGTFLRPVDELSNSFMPSEEMLKSFYKKFFIQLIQQQIPQFGNPKMYATKFLTSLGHTPHKFACSLNSGKQLVVDTLGNILTCSNFTHNDIDADGNSHKLGSVFTDSKHLAANTETFDKRVSDKCSDCVLKHMCSGSCPYTPSEYVDSLCRSQFYYYLPVFGHALYCISGGIMKNVKKIQ